MNLQHVKVFIIRCSFRIPQVLNESFSLSCLSSFLILYRENTRAYISLDNKVPGFFYFSTKHMLWYSLEGHLRQQHLFQCSKEKSVNIFYLNIGLSRAMAKK